MNLVVSHLYKLIKSFFLFCQIFSSAFEVDIKEYKMFLKFLRENITISKLTTLPKRLCHLALQYNTDYCFDISIVLWYIRISNQVGLVGWFMVFNATFNNIAVISWRSVLLVEETGVSREKPPTCRKSLTNFITIINML